MVGGDASGLPELLDTWQWDGRDWSRLGQDPAPSGQPLDLFYDRELSRPILATSDGAWQWLNGSWSQVSSAVLTSPWADAIGYDAANRRLVVAGESVWSWQMNNEWKQLAGLNAFYEGWSPDERIFMAVLEGDTLRPLTSAGAPDFIGCSAAYDRKRKKTLVLIDGSQQDPPSPFARTFLVSRVQPAQKIEIDLTPLVGSTRERAVKLDGFAFHAITGADAQLDGEQHPGAALDVWNGLTFRHVLDNAAPTAQPDSLCFESSQPATLGALEAENKWHFLVRPLVEARGERRARLLTNQFEVRVRYHLGDTVPGPAQRAERPCEPGGWAYRDFER
jgi:hypothetical protein